MKPKPKPKFSPSSLSTKPNHHSLLIQDLLLRAEVKGLPTCHHLPELLPQLPKLDLSQLLFSLLQMFLGSFGVFSPLLWLDETEGNKLGNQRCTHFSSRAEDRGS